MSLIVTLFTSWGSVGTVLQVGEHEIMKFNRPNATLTIQNGFVRTGGELENEITVFQLTGDVEIKSHTGALIQLVKLADLAYPQPPTTTPPPKEFWLELLEKRLGYVLHDVWKTSTRTNFYCGRPISVFIPKPHMVEESPIVLLGSDQAFYASCHDHDFCIDSTISDLAYAYIGIDKKNRRPIVQGFKFDLSEEEVLKLIKESK